MELRRPRGSPPRRRGRSGRTGTRRPLSGCAHLASRIARATAAPVRVPVGVAIASTPSVPGGGEQRSEGRADLSRPRRPPSCREGSRGPPKGKGCGRASPAGIPWASAVRVRGARLRRRPRSRGPPNSSGWRGEDRPGATRPRRPSRSGTARRSSPRVGRPIARTARRTAGRGPDWASEPVWLARSPLPAGVRPLLMTRTGFTSVTSRAASRNFRPFARLST